MNTQTITPITQDGPQFQSTPSTPSTPSTQSTQSTQSTTTQGTPHARSWDPAWIATVEAAEQRLGHRICGAHTPEGTPCELPPNHQNGRCRFHGGFSLTGAAHGNRNAVVHGLYSRRLRTCDTRCPLWNECPCAGPDVAALAPAKRPACPYEQTEYNTVLTDALASANDRNGSDEVGAHIAHNVALLQVMMTRAAVALRSAPLVDTITTTSFPITKTSAQQTTTARLSPQFLAFMRIAAELRHSIRMIQPPNAETECVSIGGGRFNHNTRSQTDTLLDPDNQELMHADGKQTPDPAQRDDEKHTTPLVSQKGHHDYSGLRTPLWTGFLARHNIQLPGEPAEIDSQNQTPKDEEAAIWAKRA